MNKYNIGNLSFVHGFCQMIQFINLTYSSQIGQTLPTSFPTAQKPTIYINTHMKVMSNKLSKICGKISKNTAYPLNPQLPNIFFTLEEAAKRVRNISYRSLSVEYYYFLGHNP